MSHTPHELPEEFPEYKARIRALKHSDTHFARLAEAYEALNRKIHRAESFVEPTDALHEAEMRRQRLALKDEIWKLLQADRGG